MTSLAGFSGVSQFAFRFSVGKLRFVLVEACHSFQDLTALLVHHDGHGSR